MGSLSKKDSQDQSRRFFVKASGYAAGLGVVSSYGFLGWMCGGFLAPEAPGEKLVFIAKVADIKNGASFPWTTPTGGKVLIARVAESAEENAEDFRAMTDICPHLGCKVHWRETEQNFFCPCHNGIFDAEGKATAGPPAEAGQELASFPLEVRDGMLFVKLKQEKGL